MSTNHSVVTGPVPVDDDRVPEVSPASFSDPDDKAAHHRQKIRYKKTYSIFRMH